MAELVLEELTKRFAGGVTAVRDLNLRVADGELVVLVGPSGCGKTTILRMIAGLEKPDHGVIRLNGKVVNRLSPAARDVAFVFQRPALYPHLSVRQNLEFGYRARRGLNGLLSRISPLGRQRKTAEKEELAHRVAQAAQMLQLGDVLKRRPDQLSGGQQQRVALGKALVRQPAIYLLDEPMANLDSHLRTEMRRELHLLHRRLRATMVYVTHDQTEAMALADRLVVLNQGEALQAGKPTEVYERPRDQFVAGFLGWPPMNFLTGRIEAGPCLTTKDESLPLDPAERWLTEQEGRSLTLGIRPESVKFCPSAEVPQSPLRLSMDVSEVERFGGFCLVKLQRGDWQLTAWREGACSLQERETAAVELDASRLHWFDPLSGLALKAPGAAE
jgi:ABC-type sugar transport system ATPase subunit